MFPDITDAKMSFTQDQETGKEQKSSEKKKMVYWFVWIYRNVCSCMCPSQGEHSQVLLFYCVLCSGCWRRLKVKCRILIKVEYGNIVSHWLVLSLSQIMLMEVHANISLVFPSNLNIKG